MDGLAIQKATMKRPNIDFSMFLVTCLLFQSTVLNPGVLARDYRDLQFTFCSSFSSRDSSDLGESERERAAWEHSSCSHCTSCKSCRFAPPGFGLEAVAFPFQIKAIPVSFDARQWGWLNIRTMLPRGPPNGFQPSVVFNIALISTRRATSRRFFCAASRPCPT